MRGNHYAGRPVEVVIDDIESYRWPTESMATRLEAADEHTEPPVDGTRQLVRPYVLVHGRGPSFATCQSCGGSGLKDYGQGVEGCRACGGWGDPDSRPKPVGRQPARTA